jgi:hypothetical protein
MGFSKCVSRSLGELRKLSVTVAAAMFICGISATGVLAGNIGSSTDSLSVTGATAGVLPQMFSSQENGPLAGLHVSGFLSQTFGMW